jgi:hypothetical protein
VEHRVAGERRIPSDAFVRQNARGGLAGPRQEFRNIARRGGVGRVGPRKQNRRFGAFFRDFSEAPQIAVEIIHRRIERLLNPWSFAFGEQTKLARLVNWGRASLSR